MEFYTLKSEQRIPILLHQENLFQKFLAKVGQSLYWFMVLFSFQAILNGFYTNIGDLLIVSPKANNVVNYAEVALRLVICIRLIKPAGAQDIQAMIFLCLLPGSGFYSEFKDIFTEVALITCRWHRFTRLLAVLWMALSFTVWWQPLTCRMSCTLSTFCRINEGVFIRSSDGIYKLYKYPNPNGEKSCHYDLFREITLLPGVKVVKKIDDYRGKDAASIRQFDAFVRTW